MSGVRHHDAPVMPLGPSVFAPDLRHLVGDLHLWLHSDHFLMAAATRTMVTLPTRSSLVVVIILKKKRKKSLIFVEVHIHLKSLQQKNFAFH